MSKSFDLEAWIDRDLSQAVARGELPMAFEVEEVIRQVEDLLAGHRKRSPVFVGGRGVGKTTVVHQLLRRSAEGEGWPSLESTRVVQLSLRAIAARFRTKDKGAQQFAEICNYIVSQEGAVVPFIRDVHLAYAFDWEPILHRFLDRMPVPVLCEAEPKALDEMLEYWTDFDALLAPIRIDEPGVARVRRIVDAWCEEQVAAGGPDVDSGARRAAIELTARFMGDRPFPRKVIDLLAQTVDLHMSEPSVSVQHVVHRFSQLTQVPEGLVDPQVPLDLGEVREFVGGRLLGQDEAVDSVVRMIALIKAGLADLRRPLEPFCSWGQQAWGRRTVPNSSRSICSEIGIASCG